MPSSLCFTIRFLQPYSHGRGDGGDPEWPPSPLRLFQALISASSARWNERQRLEYAVPALTWLESQPQATIVAVSGVASEVRCQFYVPDNTAELLVPAWKRGEVDKQPKRSEKVVRPTHLEGDAVHYLYQLPDGECPHLDVLQAAARSITHLGWGIDMVAADARILSREEADQLTGHRWRVVTSGGVALRVPKEGTLADLMRKHEAFLGRLSADGFRPVPPLSCFNVIHYYSPTAGLAKAPQRPMAAFEIHRTIEDQEEKAGKSRFRPFHPVRRVATVAGMVRHATAEVAKLMGKEDDWINTHIQGHGDEKEGQSTSDERLMYLPLPSLQPVVGVGAIRRVLIVGWPGCKELSDLRRRLNGAELTELPRKKNEPLVPPCELELPEQTENSSKKVAMLAHLATSDLQVQQYLGTSRCWCTVTPVILPGFDDPGQLRRKYVERVKIGEANAEEQKHLLERLDCRTLALLWKAFEQAGWTSDMLEGAELEYRKVGWLRGQDLAANYCFASKYAKYHVRVTFKHPVAGPIVIGAGRYRGFGLFTKLD